MKSPASRKLNMPRAILVAVASLCAAGCSSLRDQAVPACPYCGSPVTVLDENGVWQIVPRMRLASWTPAPAAGVASDPEPPAPPTGAR
jgi:hypothetical protein